MKAVVQHYTGTTEEWKAANPKLYNAVWGFETTRDGKTLAKLGNGVDRWNDLKYFDAENISGLPERLREIADAAERAVRIAENFSQERLQEIADAAERAVRIAESASPLSYPARLGSATPEQADLQAAYEEASGKTGEPPDLTILEDLAFHKAYKYFESKNEWADMGAFEISAFTNQTIGGILGSGEPGRVSAREDGTGEVSGWDELAGGVQELAETQAQMRKEHQAQLQEQETRFQERQAQLQEQETRFQEQHQTQIQELQAASLADQAEGHGRDLCKMLHDPDFDAAAASRSERNAAISAVMAELRRRCNNNGEIDSTGNPDFRGLAVGDYLDGLDLSGIASAPGGTAPQAWNDAYKNNRIVIAGFNTYKGAGDIEIADNHILFAFRNIIAKGRMNFTDPVDGAKYYVPEMRAWLEGTDGDGSGALAAKLNAELGSGNYLYTICSLHRTGMETACWLRHTVFLPSEYEVFGTLYYSADKHRDGLDVQYPIYQKSTVCHCKRYNGARHWWWMDSFAKNNLNQYCFVSIGSNASIAWSDNADGGVSPAFCVH